MAEWIRGHRSALAIGVAVGVIVTAIVVVALVGAGVWEDNDTTSTAHVVTLRSGDVVVDPRTATRCTASEEGGQPNLLCEHGQEAVFWNDELQVYGPGSEPMTPTYSFSWWGGSTCKPPRGPGDNSVHSEGLVTHGIGCATGRSVALACARYSYGHSGACTVAGRRWRCTSTKAPGAKSEERCFARRRSMTIVWID